MGYFGVKVYERMICEDTPNELCAMNYDSSYFFLMKKTT